MQLPSQKPLFQGIILVCILFSFLSLPACQWKGKPSSPPPTFSPNSSSASSITSANLWQPQPVNLRIYPTSQLTTQQNKTQVLEVRLELLDDMGDSTKASGSYQFELFIQEHTNDTPIGSPAYAHQTNIFTLQDHQQYYDPITRTYFFQLKINQPIKTNKPLLLTAAIITHDSRRLESKMNLTSLHPPTY